MNRITWTALEDSGVLHGRVGGALYFTIGNVSPMFPFILTSAIPLELGVGTGGQTEDELKALAEDQLGKFLGLTALAP